MRASSRLLLKTILFLGLIRTLSSQENIFTYQPDYDLALPQSLSKSAQEFDPFISDGKIVLGSGSSIEPVFI